MDNVQQAKMLKAIREGLPIEEAYKLIGKREEQLFNDEREKVDFLILAHKKQAEFMLQSLEAVNARAKSDKGHKEACWLLERVFPQYYSGKAKVSDEDAAKFQENIDAIIGSIAAKGSKE